MSRRQKPSKRERVFLDAFIVLAWTAILLTGARALL